ncbi:hypothetical protein [Rhodococcus sp. 4CII]|uniref:hypothetical protein n=1 Tax=Rhodococcus sp. 4CII TaxID=2834580 RepID=UPI00163D58CE|nr:hypothetical protein [Rhodococcus sp. 4CII]MBC2898438.1 hypothetical protein [Rhodococcus sp. 4CII]
MQQHERFQAHLAAELDRAKGRARDAGHSEAQIEAATCTDPDLDMESLRQHSAALLHTVRNLAEDPTLTSQQWAALSAAVDQAETTVTQLNIHKGALSEDARAAAVTGVAAHNGIDTAATRDHAGESEITPDQQFRQDVDTRAGELMQLLRQLRDDREVVVDGDVIGSDSYDLHNRIELEYGKLGESLAQDVLRRTPLDAAFEEQVHTRVKFKMRADSFTSNFSSTSNYIEWSSTALGPRSGANRRSGRSLRRSTRTDSPRVNSGCPSTPSTPVRMTSSSPDTSATRYTPMLAWRSNKRAPHQRTSSTSPTRPGRLAPH